MVLENPHPWKKPTGPSKDYRACIEFLEQLRPGGPWALTAILPDGPTATETFSDENGVIAFIRKHDGKRNLYFTINPTRGPITSKALRLDITAIEYLQADLDPEADETPEQAKDRYLTALTNHQPPATIIIDSGNGIQALWRLAEPVQLGELVNKDFTDNDKHTIRNIESRTKALIIKLGCRDASTFEINRIFRLPGTTNIPNRVKKEKGRVECPTKLIRFNAILHGLDQFPPLPSDHRQHATPPGNGGNTPLTSANEVFKRLPAGLKKLVASQPYEGEDSSETAASVINQLQVKGFPDAEIKLLFESHPQGIGKRYAHGKSLQSDLDRLRQKFQPETKAKISTIIRASDIQMRAKRWLWRGHLLKGALELLTGTPGLGKSQVQINLIASVTAGLPWPDGQPPSEPMNVIMLTAEDTLADEVAPRLVAAGADLKRIFIFNKIRLGGKDRMFLLQEDLEELEKNVLEIGQVALVTIDPITAYMGGKMDSHKATEVRSQLGPLKDFAERADVSVSAITHPAKHSGSKAIDQFIGSQAFVAAARIGHICVQQFDDAEEGEERVPTGWVLFAHAKHNPSKKMATLRYQIEELPAGNDPSTNELILAPRAVWDQSPVDMTADEAVAAASNLPGLRQRNRDQDLLQNLLMDILKDGPQKAIQVGETVKASGYSKKQYQTARQKLGVIATQTADGWILELPATRLTIVK